MTDQLTPLAVQHAPLLRALRAGGHASSGDLAQAAGVLKNHVHRDLGLLEERGLIVRDPDGEKHAAALTPLAEQALEVLSTAAIPFDLIDPWPDNPRTQFSDADEHDLARSIGDKGVLQPLLVRPVGERFQVVIGERRRRAAAVAVREGWKAPGFLVPAKVREISDDEALEIAGVENLQREDMHWMDEARWYLRLSARLSGAQIERLVGGARKKRSIQDYVKCARELTPADVARTYLPETDKARLTYVDARDLVGEKKEKPALDLSPKLALAFLEVIAAGLGEAFGKPPLPPVGFQVVTRFHEAPTGGPLATLSHDRKLIEFGFVSREIVAKTRLTEDVVKWLHQLHAHEDPLGALWKARAAVIGDMQTHALREGEFVTRELNFPAPAQAPPPPIGAPPAEVEADDPPPTLHREPDEDSGWREAVEAGAGQIWPDDDEGEQEEANTSTPAPSPADDTWSLPPMLAIVAIEMAHKIAEVGVEKGPHIWAAEVRESYYKDSRGAQGVQGHRAWQFFPAGRERTLCAITERTLDWLAREHDLVLTGDGRVILDDELLAILQAKLGFKPDPETGGPYATYWLNPPALAQAPAAADPPPQGEVAPQVTEGASAAFGAGIEPLPLPAAALSFSDQMRALGAEARADVVSQLAAALREARLCLLSQKSRSKPDAKAIDQAVALADAALEHVKPPMEQA